MPRQPTLGFIEALAGQPYSNVKSDLRKLDIDFKSLLADEIPTNKQGRLYLRLDNDIIVKAWVRE